MLASKATEKRYCQFCTFGPWLSNKTQTDEWFLWPFALGDYNKFFHRASWFQVLLLPWYSACFSGFKHKQKQRLLPSHDFFFFLKCLGNVSEAVLNHSLTGAGFVESEAFDLWSENVFIHSLFLFLFFFLYFYIFFISQSLFLNTVWFLSTYLQYPTHVATVGIWRHIFTFLL